MRKVLRIRRARILGHPVCYPIVLNEGGNIKTQKKRINRRDFPFLAMGEFRLIVCAFLSPTDKNYIHIGDDTMAQHEEAYVKYSSAFPFSAIRHPNGDSFKLMLYIRTRLSSTLQEHVFCDLFSSV